MSSPELKAELHKYIDQLDDRLLNLLHSMIVADLRSGERSFIEQYNKELEEAEARIDTGEFIENGNVKTEISQWLGKGR